MQLPAVTPIDGSSMDTALGYLTTIRNNLANMGTGTAPKVLSQYQQWVSASAETLGYAFDQDAIEALVLTRRSWLLMETIPVFGEADNGPAIFKTFEAEKTDRVRFFDKLITTYRSIGHAWGKAVDKFVVPDTNFFLHHDVSFEQADWPKIAAAIAGEPVRVLVPIAVIRELDRQKTNGKAIKVGEDNDELRGRARRSLRTLRAMFENPSKVARLNDWTTIELVLDPLSHRPFGTADTEIIERALTAKRISGKDISLLTKDLAMKLTARSRPAEWCVSRSPRDLGLDFRR